MYRSIINFILLIVFAPLATAVTIDDIVKCTYEDLFTQSCGIIKTSYVYDNQYGPRKDNYIEDYESFDNVPNFTPGLGWHNGQSKVVWKSSTLVPENIKKDKVIFGVTGTLDNTVYGNCVLNQTNSDVTSPNAGAPCYVPSGSNYVYSTFLGGRNNRCTFTPVSGTTAYKISNALDGSNPKGSCWIDTAGAQPDGFNIDAGALKTSGTPNFVIRNTVNSTTCPLYGITVGYQNTSCTTPDRSVGTSNQGYFYPSGWWKTYAYSGQTKWITGAYGGRSKNCIYGSNAEPCWIDDPTAVVLNDTACSEKVPDGTPVGPSGLGDPLNPYSCKTAATNMTVFTNNGQSTSTKGRFVYRSPRGGRNLDCTQLDRSGYCWVNATHKNDLEPDLVPGNIQKGIVLFGIRGTLSTAEIVYGSGAHRTPSSGAPNRLSYKETGVGESNILETNAASAASVIYPAAYHPIPKVSTDAESDVVKVNRATWSNTECGTSGSLGSRISNCAAVFGANAQWLGTIKGNAGQSDWTLVTRRRDSVDTSKTYEVWKDSGTGLLWSSLVSTSLNWCKASGSNGKTNTSNGVTTYDASTAAEDDPSNYCDSVSYQNQTTPVSACSIDDGYNTGTYQFSTAYNSSTTPGKAGLLPSLATTSGRVMWRLPSMYDYMLANHHGLRFVLPDAGVGSDEEWTATVSANNRKNAWTFSGVTGSRQFKQRNNPAAVRCIGR